MKFTAAMALAASATLATAQITFDASGIIKCPKPLAGAFCVGDSLDTKTIATCDAEGIGQRGLCSEFLAAKPPYGSNDVLCYQSSDTAGDAACVKGGVVYDITGQPRFTLSADSSEPKITAPTVSDDWEVLPTSSPCPLESAGTEIPAIPGVPATSEPVLPSVNPIPPVSGPPEPIPTGEPWAPSASGTLEPLPSGAPIQPLPAESVPPVSGGNGGNDTFTAPTFTATDTPMVEPSATTTSIPMVPISAAPAMKQVGAVMIVVGLAVACLL
ncbi:hypothetical protein MAPG_05492 [Magnaporthiopsis poae ATCC 64411]|uniref:Uncharacterized protein n=1 Tax=Magnaporthiopsis poae (strain ATCC 64411 / 73-15) TaxID=644358 RepID=A0A0C4DZJ0_MAGP6|nr:hypothetical protein MAPG_05492 [Magnaporthiopsis poae ATCC 64411]